jgi:hypothetical protein
MVVECHECISATQRFGVLQHERARIIVAEQAGVCFQR